MNSSFLEEKMNNKIIFQLNNRRNVQIIKILLVFQIFMIVLNTLLIFFYIHELFYGLPILLISLLMTLVIVISLNNLYKSILFTQDYFILETELKKMYKFNYNEIIKLKNYKIVTKKRVIYLKNINNKDEILAQINERII